MWYFAWILGLAAALGFGILNALWLEFTPDGMACEEIECAE